MLGATYFEMPVTALDRAVTFHGQGCGGALERAEIDGNAMALFPETEDGAGVSGALAHGKSYAPSLDGSRVCLAVESIDDTPGWVLDLGGAALSPKTEAGGWGWVTEARDSEGNRIALGAANQERVASSELRVTHARPDCVRDPRELRMAIFSLFG